MRNANEEKRMIKHNTVCNSAIRENYAAKTADNCLRAEIKSRSFNEVFLCKLKRINGKRSGFLIKQNSIFLDLLKVGTVLEVNYWLSEKKHNNVKLAWARVHHIKELKQKPFQGYYLVGLSKP
jgi:hypothetical protein